MLTDRYDRYDTCIVKGNVSIRDSMDRNYRYQIYAIQRIIARYLI